MVLKIWQMYPQGPNICHICKLLHAQISGNYVNYSYRLNAVNSVTISTGIHTFHSTCICCWINVCHIAHICPTTPLPQPTYKPHITTHTCQKSIDIWSFSYRWGSQNHYTQMTTTTTTTKTTLQPNHIYIVGHLAQISQKADW